MAQTAQVNIIARIRSDFSTKFGIPRQSGLVEELEAAVVFEPETCAACGCWGWTSTPRRAR